MDTLSVYSVETAATVTTVALGTSAPSSSDDTPLRVRNNSDLYQAAVVTVVVDSAVANSNQLWLSTDGLMFSSSIQLGDIPPGGVSAPFWLRRATPAGSAGARTGQMTVSSSGWVDPVDSSPSTNVPITED